MLAVPPARPVISVSEPFNTVSWSLPQDINEDERADLFTVSLNFTNGITWKACISDERFIGIGVEFQVAVRNTHGHLSQTVEPIEPPGKHAHLHL